MAAYQTNAQSKLNIIDLLNGVKRRSKLVIVSFALIFVGFFLLAFLWPATYTSNGVILIEQQELPQELVRSTITSYADQRIQSLSQRVMTTENLNKLIKQFDLYADERKTRTREYVIDKMRDDVGFKIVSANVVDPRTGVPGKATIAFSVSYSSRSPVIASKVANELVSLYLQQNLENRKSRTQETTTFLSDEVARLDKDILSQQEILAQFKLKHLNDLPEKTQINIEMMNRSVQDVRDIETRINAIDQQIVFLDSQLVQISPTSQVFTSTGERVYSPEDRLKYLRTELARLTGTYGEQHPDVKRMQREVAGLEASVKAKDAVNDLQRQLKSLQTQLTSALQKYSEDHPDVVKLQRSIGTLEARIKDELSKEGANSDTQSRLEETADNPAYIQIKTQREASIAERDALVGKKNELKAQVTAYESRLTSGPSVEREYNTLLRDLESTQLKYRELKQKKLEAEVSENLETERKGERFTLIDPPLTPEKPSTPNRVLILILGVLVSLFAPLGFVVLRENLDTSVRSRFDLQALLNVAPLAVMPWFQTDAERILAVQKRNKAIKIYVSASVVLIIAVHFLYIPLDVLWQMAIRRLLG